MDFKGRDFSKVLDYTPEELRYLIGLAITFKEKKKNKEPHRYLQNKNMS